MSRTTAKIVCPVCEGNGYTSTIGSFTSGDIDEAYGDDWDARDDFVREYTRVGGAYDEPCQLCKGNNVVTPEQLSEWDEYQQMSREY